MGEASAEPLVSGEAGTADVELRRIARLAKFLLWPAIVLRGLVMIVLCLCPVLAAFVLLDVPGSDFVRSARLNGVDVLDPELAKGWLVAFFSMTVASLIALLVGVGSGADVLAQYAKGRVFETETASQLARMGFAAMVFGLIPGVDVAAQHIDRPAVVWVGVGLSVVLASWVSRVGERFREESEFARAQQRNSETDAPNRRESVHLEDAVS